MSHTPSTGRTCYITQWYPPEPVGVSHWIPEQLSAEGWHVTVLTGVPNWPSGRVHEGYRADRASREWINGLEVRRTPLYPSHDSSAVRRMANYVSWALSSAVYGLKDVRKSDVAVVHSSPATAALPAMVARTIFGTPYVLMIQDLWPDSIFSSGFLNRGLVAKVASTTLGWFTRASYRMASHITVLSPSMIDLLVARGVPREKISLVYNWVDEAALATADPDPKLRSELGIGADDFVVMYAGAHGPAQGLHTLIEAMAGIEPSERIHLVMVGDGIELDSLKSLADRLEVQDRVHFLGRRPMAEMPALIAAANLQVVSLIDTPLFRVNMPSKVPTLLHSGSVLLVVAEGDPVTVVTEADAGFTASPDDPGQVAEAIRAASRTDPARLREMGENGRRAYLEMMSARIGTARLTGILSATFSTAKKEKRA